MIPLTFKELIANLLRLSKIIQREQTFSISFYESIITLISKPGNDITKKIKSYSNGHRYKKYKQNLAKFNLAAYKKDYSLCPLEIYSRNARVDLHKKIRVKQQNNGMMKNIISLIGKKFGKSSVLFMTKTEKTKK